MFDQSQQNQYAKQLLSKPQLQCLLTTMQYLSHILFPSVYEQQLQQKQPQSIMKRQNNNQFEVQNQTYFQIQVEPSLQQKFQNADNKNRNKNNIKQSISRNQQIQMMQQQRNGYITIKVKIYHDKLIQKIQDFQRICIQLFYFVFACMKKSLMVVFNEDLFIYSRINRRFMVNLKQISEAKIKSNTKNSKSYYTLYIQIIKQLVSTLQYNLSNICQILQKRKPKMEIQNNVKKTDDQILTIKIKQQDIQNMLRSYKILLNDALLVDNSLNQDAACFIELQKSEFIANNSNLYKIRNRSLNIFLYRHANQQIKQKFIGAIKNQKTLMQKYSNIKCMIYGNKEQLKDINRKIYANFQKYVQQSWEVGKNPIYIKIVQPKTQNNPTISTNNSIQNIPISKIIFKSKFKSISEKFQFRQQISQPQQIIQFTIQILSFANTSSFCVRLHTPLTIQQSTSDQVIQNWNSIICQSNHNISLQIGQKPEMLHKKKKYMIIKTMSEGRNGESVIVNCLRLMDLAVVGYVVLRSWDYHITDNAGEKYDKLKQIIGQLNHYSALMTDLSNKLYQFV